MIVALVCGAVGKVTSLIIVGATSNKLLNEIDRRCNSAKEVCFTVVGSVAESMISWCFFCSDIISLILSLNS